LAILQKGKRTESSTSIKNKLKKELTHFARPVRMCAFNQEQQTKNEKDKTQNQNQQKQRINQAGILDTIQSLATKK
jgi:hypothetical protein